ncbi:hypothetical protein D3C86_1880460 [compost metagenome]
MINLHQRVRRHRPQQRQNRQHPVSRADVAILPVGEDEQQGDDRDNGGCPLRPKGQAFIDAVAVNPCMNQGDFPIVTFFLNSQFDVRTLEPDASEQVCYSITFT